jgi:hypothetical protein
MYGRCRDAGIFEGHINPVRFGIKAGADKTALLNNATVCLHGIEGGQAVIDIFPDYLTTEIAKFFLYGTSDSLPWYNAG